MVKSGKRDRKGKFESNGGVHVCPYCGQEFPGPNSLDWHMKICGAKK